MYLKLSMSKYLFSPFSFAFLSCFWSMFSFLSLNDFYCFYYFVNCNQHSTGFPKHPEPWGTAPVCPAIVTPLLSRNHHDQNTVLMYFPLTLANLLRLALTLRFGGLCYTNRVCSRILSNYIRFQFKKTSLDNPNMSFKMKNVILSVHRLLLEVRGCSY